MACWARNCCAVFTLLLAALPGSAQQAADFFGTNCASCHTIGGGRLVGPDLKFVSQRRERAWLEKFLQNPKAVIDSGDPYAQQLVKDSQGIVMPTLGVTAAQAISLVDFIDVESKKAAAQFTGTPVNQAPFTAQDVVDGRAVFLGYKRLAKGGPSCISCHTFKGVGGLSGGRLGPDLTLVFERLGGRKGLSAWLSNPASSTMTPVFKTHPLQPQEVQSLVALFEDTARKGGTDDSAALLNFLLLGLGGSVVGMVALDAIWRKRFRGVRRQLVHPQPSSGNREVMR